MIYIKLPSLFFLFFGVCCMSDCIRQSFRYYYFFFFADPDDSGDAEEGDPDEVGVAAIRILLAAAAAGDRAVCRWASAASACWPLSSAC